MLMVDSFVFRRDLRESRLEHNRAMRGERQNIYLEI